MSAQRIKLSNFKFELPQEQIAQYPLDNRDDARLLVVDRATGKFEHKMFKDLIDMFDEDDVLLQTTLRFSSKTLEIKKRLERLSRCSYFVSLTRKHALGCSS